MTTGKAIKTSWVSYQMLGANFQYFIDLVKDPLRRAIINYAKRHFEKVGQMTRQNTCQTNVHALLDIRDKFMRYHQNPGRQDMLVGAQTVLASEFEHDPYYIPIGGWYLEEVIKKILDGEWEAREEGTPLPQFWTEPQPYGGQHSIIQKLMNHREEIKKILEADNA